MNNKLKWKKFNEGNAKGISIFTTDEYYLVYENGNTDPEMFYDLEKSKKKDLVIFDVGTFIGLSSLVFSKYCGNNGRVISFEPNPYNVERANKNFEKNKELSSRITLFSYALSNTNDNIDMLLSSVIEGPSSTSRISGTHPTISDEDLPDVFVKQKVITRKLDSVVKELNVIPDIIKIDIEGAEHLMLLGAVSTLEKNHPTLYIEMHSQYCTLKCCELLAIYNYNFMILKEENDNRIMIKATYNPSNQSTNISEYIKYEEIINVLHAQEKHIESISNNYMQNKINQNDKLQSLLNYNEQKNIKVDMTEKSINNLENSINILFNKLDEKISTNYNQAICELGEIIKSINIDSVNNKIELFNDKITNLEENNKNLFLEINELNKNYDLSITEKNNEILELNKLLDSEKRINDEMISSRSWKITKPLRNASSKLRKKNE